MKGIVHKNEQGNWEIEGDLLINPYQQQRDFREGEIVEYEEELFWETGIETPFKVATLENSWRGIYRKWILESCESNVGGFQEWLEENYEVPSKKIFKK
jgi:hypothetical protein